MTSEASSEKQIVIPAGWEARPLSWAISGLRAGVSVNSEPQAKGADGRPSVLKTSAIFAGRLNLEERKPIAAKDLERARSSLQAGTILISRMNTPALVGECGYVETEQPDVYLPDRIWMTEFTGNRGLSSRWLASVLSSNAMRSRLKEIATGTSGSMKNIAKRALLSQVILFPPLKEQEAIAGALSDADALIEGLERLIAKKRLIKQGAMQDLLTGKRRLPGFSGEWAMKTLGDLAHMKSGEGITSASITENGDFPVYGGNGLRGYTSTFNKDGECTLVGRQGALCGAVVHTIGRIFASEHAIVCKATSGNNQRYLSHLFEFLNLNRVSEASAQPGLSVEKIRKIEVLASPIEREQADIAEILDDMDAEIQALETRFEKARQVKEGMMQNLLTGRTRLV